MVAGWAGLLSAGTHTCTCAHAHGVACPGTDTGAWLWKHSSDHQRPETSLGLLWEIMSFWAKNKPTSWKSDE